MIQQIEKERHDINEESKNKENSLKFLTNKVSRDFFSIDHIILENTDQSCSLKKKLNLNSPEPKFTENKTLPSNSTKKITCNCKNSQCLKLYCECFSTLGFCDPNFCSCKGCSNTNENEVK